MLFDHDVVLADLEAGDHSAHGASAREPCEPIRLVDTVHPNLYLLEGNRRRYLDVKAGVSARNLIGSARYDFS